MALNTKIFVAGVAVAASLAAVSPASALDIVNPITGGTGAGGSFVSGDVGTITSLKLSQANTYDFTFTIAPGAFVVLMQAEASSPAPVNSELLQFTVYDGTPPAPGTGTEGTSPLEDGPSLTKILGAGAYFMHIDNIALDQELLSGGLDVSAVPEPMTWALMLAGLGGVGATLRRRQTKPINA
jgi:hypothetical protein